MIVYWPDVTPAGSVSGEPIIVEDFFPTILEIAGVGEVRQVGGVVDGRSFARLLWGQRDQPRANRPLFWHFPNNWGPTGPGIGPASAIRLGDWKLIYYHESRRYELFNLAEDLGEKNNLAERQPDVRRRLAAALGTYLTSVDAQMPVIKATGQAVPYPGCEED
jgi:arylsulfatase A-like enzyme